MGNANWANWLHRGANAIRFLRPSARRQVMSRTTVFNVHKGKPETEGTEGVLTHSYLICQHD